MNVVVLTGRLVADPTLKYTPNGKAVTELRVAVDRRFKNEGEQTADFFDVVAWGQSAEFICNYGGKGQRVSIEGRLQQRSWEKDGQKRSKIEVVANSLQLLDKKQGEAKQEAASDEPDYDPFESEG